MRSFGPTEAAISVIKSHEQVIEIALRINDDELAQAVVDLARTARREFLGIGFTSAFTEAQVSGYEMLLTQHLMPEISARLNRNAQTPLILSRDELGDGSTARLEGGELRRLTGLCWSRTDFARIGAVVRTRFDPDEVMTGKVFATEVIGQEPSNGNLLEIALGRVAPPVHQDPTREQDWFAERILRAGRLRGLEKPSLVWSPEMRPALDLERYEAPEPV